MIDINKLTDMFFRWGAGFMGLATVYSMGMGLILLIVVLVFIL